MSVRFIFPMNLFASILVVGVALSTNSHAQQKTVIDQEYVDGSGRAVGILSSGEIIIGSDFFTGHNTSFITILNVSRSGQQQWKKEFNFREMNSVRSIAVDQNDFIYVLGEQENKERKDTVFILKLDKSGNLIWRKLYGQRYSYHDASSLKQDRAGNLTFILHRNEVIRIDQDGNILSKQTALWKELDVAAFTFDDQNNMIAVGDIGDNIYAMKVDQKGSVLNTFSYVGKGKDWAHDIASFEGGVVISGRTEVAEDTAHRYLASLDNNLKERWHKVYDDGGAVSTLDIRNGKEIVVLSYGHNLYFFDDQGNSKAVKKYSESLIVLKIKGEEIVMVGTRNHHVWLVKTE